MCPAILYSFIATQGASWLPTFLCAHQPIRYMYMATQPASQLLELPGLRLAILWRWFVWPAG
jgi:hypothetical protein